MIMRAKHLYQRLLSSLVTQGRQLPASHGCLLMITTFPNLAAHLFVATLGTAGTRHHTVVVTVSPPGVEHLRLRGEQLHDKAVHPEYTTQNSSSQQSHKANNTNLGLSTSPQTTSLLSSRGMHLGCNMIHSVVVLLCVCLCLFITINGYPAGFPERRVSRDLDQSETLRTQLKRLQEKISHLEASEMGVRPTPEMPRDARVSENDDKAESDISSLANDRTAQTISAISDNQRKIQSLGKTLSDKKPVSQVLKEALEKLREQEASQTRVDTKNSAGEYLGDNYLPQEEGETKVPQSANGGESDRGQRLEAIYRMLLRMYSKQSDSKVNSGHEDGPNGEVQQDRQEGHTPVQSDSEFRDAVLEAFEVKLLKDLDLAEQAGFSVEEIMADLRKKSARDQQTRLQTIKRQLDELDRSPRL